MSKLDHVMELEHEPSLGFRKVYPMTLTEQKEMDAFAEEALATDHIRQSKLYYELRTSLSRRRMANYALCRTTMLSTPLCARITTHFFSSTT
jgi:hypothetical protein